MAIEIGSAEARRVLEADKLLAQDAERPARTLTFKEPVTSSARRVPGLNVYRVQTTAEVVQMVAARDETEAIEAAAYHGTWEYEGGGVSQIGATVTPSPGYGLDVILVSEHERFMKHRGAASKAP